MPEWLKRTCFVTCFLSMFPLGFAGLLAASNGSTEEGVLYILSQCVAGAVALWMALVWWPRGT